MSPSPFLATLQPAIQLDLVLKHCFLEKNFHCKDIDFGIPCSGILHDKRTMPPCQWSQLCIPPSTAQQHISLYLQSACRKPSCLWRGGGCWKVQWKKDIIPFVRPWSHKCYHKVHVTTWTMMLTHKVMCILLDPDHRPGVK